MTDHGSPSRNAPLHPSAAPPPDMPAWEASPVLDPSALEAMAREVGAAVMPRLLEVFRDECRNRSKTLLALPDTQAKAATLIAREAHALKSAAASFGCLRLAELARAIDALAKQGETARVLALAPRLITALAEAKAALPTEWPGSGQPPAPS